jgi:CRISPR-associated protein Cas2
MALNVVRTWLIAYDVRDPLRLQRVHRYLRSEAVPVQYSVFVARCATNHICAIKGEVAARIDPAADDVRIYQIPDRPEIATLGAQGLPEGIRLLEGNASPTTVPFTSSGAAHTLAASSGPAGEADA